MRHVLDAVGLSPLEERTYRRLVTLASGSIEELADQLESTLSATGAAMETLERHGLVARSTGSPGHYVAAPPAVAVGSLIVQRQERLQRAQHEVAVLAEQYRGASLHRAATDVIDVIHGPQAVAQRFLQLQRGARREVCALVKADVAVVSAEENPDEASAVGRGVAYRVVLERAVMDRPGFTERAAASLEAGEQIRIADSLPLRMLVADRDVALVPLAETADIAGGGALLVHRSGLLDALLTLFELTWEQAHLISVTGAGLQVRQDDGIDDTDATVLTLLLAGLTDHAIGSQLGLSLRTVQRRVRQLMDIAGVETRFQLGHECRRRGWLSGPNQG